MRVLTAAYALAVISSASGFSPAAFGARRATFLTMSEPAQKGTVNWFDGKKGFGFITADDGSGDVFVHQSQIRKEGFRSLEPGEPVEFNTGVDPKGKISAQNVISIETFGEDIIVPSDEADETADAAVAEAETLLDEAKAAEEAKAKAEAEAEAKAAEDAKAEAEAKAAEEAKAKAEAEAKAAEDAKAEAEAKAAEEAKAKAEAEAKAAEAAKAEAEAKAAEEAKAKAEAEAKAAEKAEAEAKAAEEAKAKAEAEAKAAEEARLAAENAPAALAAKYGEMDLEERAFNILMDLGIIQASPDPDSPDYDSSQDDELAPENANP